MKQIKILLSACIFLLTIQAKAQTNIISSQDAYNLMQPVYKSYDSLPFISFDVRFHLSSDTLLGNFQDEILDGSYTMAGKKAIYHMGEIDFMQNDSFVVAVYPSDKMIIIDEPKTAQTGKQLPMRDMIDSSILVMDTVFQFAYSENADTGLLVLRKADTVLAGFDSMAICFDKRLNFLKTITYYFKDYEGGDSTAVPFVPLTIRRKQLEISFNNYGYKNESEELYNLNNYVYLDHGVYKPVEKYEYFKVYYSIPPKEIIVEQVAN